uniref:Nuclear pore glycoprotein p62 n=1 Tax=Aegilops tauschii TaxID=37682 RepID=M8CDA9_AEGTA
MATSFAFGNSGGAGSTSSSPFSFSTAPSAFSSSPAPAFGSSPAPAFAASSSPFGASFATPTPTFASASAPSASAAPSATTAPATSGASLFSASGFSFTVPTASSAAAVTTTATTITTSAATTPSTTTTAFPSFSLPAPASTSATQSTLLGGSTTAASTLATIATTSQATSSAIQASSTGLYIPPQFISTMTCYCTCMARASTSAITPAAPQAAKLPSEIVGKCVEEIIRDWNNGLQDRTAKFRKHATAISEWDRRILQNRNVLIRLEADVAKVVETQTSLERQLELIETHQKEVDKALQSMEEEAERIFQDERVLLREDEAASARDIMYEQGEVVENELQHMTEQVKSIIQTMNSTQGGELEATDTMAPFDVAVRILDNQLRSLMWIDEKANEFSNRIQRLPNNSTAAERDSGIPRFWLS